jgi:predicted TIM-barrel fold metal-dependent hydrolase
MYSGRIISADSHVSTSHQQVLDNLASKWHDAYDQATGGFARAQQQAAAQANQQWTRNPHRHPAAGRMGNQSASERLADMDADGVDVEVLYSELSGFRYFNLMGSDEGGNAATRAFNDALTEFASADPDRLVVSYQLPLHDVNAAVKEVHRVKSIGGKSLQLPVFPPEMGLPDYWLEHWDPLWAAITETNLPITCHVGLNTALNSLAQRDPTPQRGIMVSVIAPTTAEAFGMWMVTGVLERFPDLKLVFVETQLGWVPWYLHIMDDLATRQRYEFPAIKELPSFYFRRNIHLTFIEDPWVATDDRYTLGINNLMWSTDYPHPVSSWPNSQQIIEEQLKGLPEDEQELILHGNAARVWNLN